MVLSPILKSPSGPKGAINGMDPIPHVDERRFTLVLGWYEGPGHVPGLVPSPQEIIINANHLTTMIT